MSHIKTSFQITVEPATLVVSLAEAREHLRNEDQSFDDDLITAAIKAATRWCENYTGRGFITQTWRQNPAAFGQRIVLSKNAVQSVTHIKYYDENNVQQTLSTSNYQLDNLSDTASIFEGISDGFPTFLVGKVNPIEIIYIVGYGDASTDVPTDIIHAIKVMIAYFYQNREMINVPVASIATQIPIPSAVKSLLSSYRVRMFG